MGCHKHVTVDRLLFSYSVANNIELTQSVMLVVSIQSKGLHSAGYFGQLTACYRGCGVSRCLARTVIPTRKNRKPENKTWPLIILKHRFLYCLYRPGEKDRCIIKLN